ncbi:MAG: hypothetical protein G3H99_01575 [Ferrovum sp.]|nr:hypothetical protein [Ferrovum sp.]NDU86732.1 hypothetical protein [Ferrovum sp.]
MKGVMIGGLGLLWGLLDVGCAEVAPDRPPLVATTDQGSSPWLRACAEKSARPQQVMVDQFRAQAQLQWRIQGKTVVVRVPEDLSVQCRERQEEWVLSGSSWVFAGYGRVIPALGWDDYGSLDVHGKTVILLSGSPPIPPDTGVDSAKALDSAGVFVHETDLQKSQRAWARGAALVVVVVTAPEEVAEHDAYREVRVREGDSHGGGVVGWVGVEQWKRWLQHAHIQADGLIRQAQREGFKALPLSLESRGNVHCQWRTVTLAVPQENQEGAAVKSVSIPLP